MQKLRSACSKKIRYDIAMENHKFCPNCGHSVQENSRFCQECGAPLVNTGAELATRRQSWNESAPAQNQPPQQNPIVVHNQQSRNIVIDVTPPEERNDAIKMKRAAKNWFIAAVISVCIVIYQLCSGGNLIWCSILTTWLLLCSLTRWIKYKNLIKMSNDEYHHEIQKMKRQKEFLGGIVQGYVEGYINEKFRK